jgi:hypothetical protein
MRKLQIRENARTPKRFIVFVSAYRIFLAKLFELQTVSLKTYRVAIG